jgi:hypothetical protein
LKNDEILDRYLLDLLTSYSLHNRVWIDFLIAKDQAIAKETVMKFVLKIKDLAYSNIENGLKKYDKRFLVNGIILVQTMLQVSSRLKVEFWVRVGR